MYHEDIIHKRLQECTSRRMTLYLSIREGIAVQTNFNACGVLSNASCTELQVNNALAKPGFDAYHKTHSNHSTMLM
jgi:hypothetical protein